LATTWLPFQYSANIAMLPIPIFLEKLPLHLIKQQRTHRIQQILKND